MRVAKCGQKTTVLSIKVPKNMALDGNKREFEDNSFRELHFMTIRFHTILVICRFRKQDSMKLAQIFGVWKKVKPFPVKIAKNSVDNRC